MRRAKPDRRSPRQIDPLEVGQKIHDPQEARWGIVLDSARQYSHPKADPVYSYLVRWDDGQVQAISEAVLTGSQAVKLVDN